MLLEKHLVIYKIEIMEINTTTALSFLKTRIKESFYKFITNESMSIFLRGNDTISIAPLINGFHEQAHVNIISNYTKIGFSDFFIDIGANIGLSSCQSGSNFNKVICFEPNPLCANILRTNLSISLDESSFEVHEFALGDVDGKFDLFIPKYNWGGAFVKTDNDYSDNILSGKDGFGTFDNKNYSIKNIEVRNAKTIFDGLFSSLIKNKLNKGIIKIDVEGYEKKILLALANTLPSSFEVIIIFENWDKNLNLNEIRRAFSNRDTDFSKFSRSIIGTNKSKLRKLYELFLFGDKTILSSCYTDNIIGDIVIKIK